MSLPARREALAVLIRKLAACSGVHSACCKYCPSRPGNPIDPETAEILALPRDERIKTIFPCAWGPKKFCRVYFDQVGAEESDLPAIERERRIEAGWQRAGRTMSVFYGPHTKYFIGPVHVWLVLHFPSWNSYYLG